MLASSLKSNIVVSDESPHGGKSSILDMDISAEGSQASQFKASNKRRQSSTSMPFTDQTIAEVFKRDHNCPIATRLGPDFDPGDIARRPIG